MGYADDESQLDLLVDRHRRPQSVWLHADSDNHGIGLLLAHVVAGTDAEVSLGSFPPFVILVDAIAGAILPAIGGLITRTRIGRSA